MENPHYAVERIDMFDRLEDLLIRFEEIMGELGEPTVTNNQERFRALMKEQSDLTPIVNRMWKIAFPCWKGKMTKR